MVGLAPTATRCRDQPRGARKGDEHPRVSVGRNRFFSLLFLFLNELVPGTPHGVPIKKHFGQPFEDMTA